MPKFKYVPSASAVPDLTEPEQAQYNQLLDQAKKAIRPQQTVTQTQWIESRTAGYCARHPNVDKGIIVDIIRKAIDDKKLTSDFEITLDDATIVTVREILDDKEKYHGRRCHDPLEPEYHKDNRIGYINTKAPSPNIYSHAHGGQRFKLSNLKPTVILQPGKLNQVSDAIIEILSNEGKYYCYGNSIVKVTPTKLIRLTTETLAVEIHRSMNIGKILKAGETPTDIPIQMARTVYASASNHGLPTLKSLIHYPTLQDDGTILDEEGYDKKTGIYYMPLNDSSYQSVPKNPSKAKVKKLLKKIFQIYKNFPFNTVTDKSVFLAALLTAVIRRSLPTAPAFAFEASTPGSGKTLLAKCLAVYAGDPHPTIRTPCISEEEWKKSLLAAACEYNSVLIYDNASRSLYGDALNAFLTAPTFGGRVLGHTAEAKAQTNILFVFTGNNLQIIGDLNRRVLRCRIEPGTEHPEERVFDNNPYEYCIKNQPEIIVDALTIIRGYLTHGKHVSTTSTGSFETWDKLVRQTVIWASTLKTIDLCDPNESFKANADDDIDKQEFFALLHAWHELHAGDFKSVSDILQKPWTPIHEIPPKERSLDEITFNIARDKNGKLSGKHLSWYLRARVDRQVNGLKLVRGKKKYGLDTWAVVNA